MGRALVGGQGAVCLVWLLVAACSPPSPRPFAEDSASRRRAATSLPPPPAAAAPSEIPTPPASTASASASTLPSAASASTPPAAASAKPPPICTTKTVAPPLGTQPRCDRDDECRLVSAVCCFCGAIPRGEVRAAHVDGRMDACAPGTSCPACVASAPENITGACLNHVCRGVEKICK